MKKTFFYTLISAALFFTLSAVAQEKMASPAAKAEGKAGSVNITIDYFQPSAKGRKIMGGLVPYGEVWRTGANGTTQIEFSGDVKIEGKDLAKGKYGLFTVPGEKEWIIIFANHSGNPFDYAKEKDVLRVTVKPGKTDAFVETFTIDVEKSKVNLKWENTVVSFKVSAK